MARQARERTEDSIYHIIQRGNNRKAIFKSNDDKNKYLDILKKKMDIFNFKIYAYCLMDNHVHMIIYDNGNDISKIMKSLSISYVSYFNRKYDSVGHLFQGRYKSEIVTDDEYLLELVRYIHNNPVKAQLVRKPEIFEYSSHKLYLYAKDNDLIDIDYVLNILNPDRKKAVKLLDKFVKNTDQEDLPEINYFEKSSEIKLKKDRELLDTLEKSKVYLHSRLQSEHITLEQLLNNKKKRNSFIKDIRKNSKLTLKEIGALFGGIKTSTLSKIINN